mmetsp:Transcript_9129/g.36820  ORF Transcript_9129/g.36820 Transcript_9129/m.36820 type:complete len:84 (-) Transcript_9129:105-356(-)
MARAVTTRARRSADTGPRRRRAVVIRGSRVVRERRAGATDAAGARTAMKNDADAISQEIFVTFDTRALLSSPLFLARRLAVED